MNIIKLNAIDSTNTYLINLVSNKELEDRTIVVAIDQKKGRGQIDASWQSTPHQSLTFSVFKKFKDLPVQKLSSIAFAVSLGVNKALNNMLLPKITIKWPNDIMSYSKKIAGILIENQIKRGKIISSVIGVGINVNQEKFEFLPEATSMLLVTGKKISIDEVLMQVSEAILIELTRIEKGEYDLLKKEYEDHLFRKDIISVFEDLNENRFNGKVRGVTGAGEILIEKDEKSLTNYQLKEIKMLL